MYKWSGVFPYPGHHMDPRGGSLVMKNNDTLMCDVTIPVTASVKPTLAISAHGLNRWIVEPSPSPWFHGTGTHIHTIQNLFGCWFCASQCCVFCFWCHVLFCMLHFAVILFLWSLVFLLHVLFLVTNADKFLICSAFQIQVCLLHSWLYISSVLHFFAAAFVLLILRWDGPFSIPCLFWCN